MKRNSSSRLPGLRALIVGWAVVRGMPAVMRYCKGHLQYFIVPTNVYVCFS